MSRRYKRLINEENPFDPINYEEKHLRTFIFKMRKKLRYDTEKHN